MTPVQACASKHPSTHPTPAPWFERNPRNQRPQKSGTQLPTALDACRELGAVQAGGPHSTLPVPVLTLKGWEALGVGQELDLPSASPFHRGGKKGSRREQLGPVLLWQVPCSETPLHQYSVSPSRWHDSRMEGTRCLSLTQPPFPLSRSSPCTRPVLLLFLDSGL